MKRASRRPTPSRFVSAATVAALSLVLTACGSSTESATAGLAADDAPAASSTPEPTPTQAASSPTPEAPSNTPNPDDSSPGAEPAGVPDILKFSGETVDGSAFEGSSLAGRPAVLWFWAPWCPTCRAQAPGVTSLADEYADDVAFVGVGGLDDGAAIADFAATTPGVTQLTDPEGSVWRHFSIVEQSVYVVVDAQGDVVADGYLSDSDLADAVAGLS